MIAEYSKSLLAFELAQNAGTLPGGAVGKTSRSKPAGNIITRQKYCVGFDAVYLVDYLAQEGGLSVFVHVNIAELDDAKAIEDTRKPGQKDVALRDLNPVAFNHS